MPRPAPTEPESINFAFLQEHDPLLLRLGATAECHSQSDPNAAVVKIRQFGEALARHLAASFGIASTAEANQAELLSLLQRHGHLDRDMAALLHALRKEGNDAAHRFDTRKGQARQALKLARTAAIWFHRSFGKNTAHFQPGPIQDVPLQRDATALPSPPSMLIDPVMEQRLADEQARRVAAEEQLAHMAGERSLWERLAQDEKQMRLQLQSEFHTTLRQLIADALARSNQQTDALAGQVAAATQSLVLDEDETRSMIDDQLRAAGWEADTRALRFSQGAQPEAGRNLAIAEWPTGSGPADHMLFLVPASSTTPASGYTLKNRIQSDAEIQTLQGPSCAIPPTSSPSATSRPTPPRCWSA